MIFNEHPFEPDDKYHHLSDEDFPDEDCLPMLGDPFIGMTGGDLKSAYCAAEHLACYIAQIQTEAMEKSTPEFIGRMTGRIWNSTREPYYFSNKPFPQNAGTIYEQLYKTGFFFWVYSVMGQLICASQQPVKVADWIGPCTSWALLEAVDDCYFTVLQAGRIEEVIESVIIAWPESRKPYSEDSVKLLVQLAASDRTKRIPVKVLDDFRWGFGVEEVSRLRDMESFQSAIQRGPVEKMRNLLRRRLRNYDHLLTMALLRLEFAKAAQAAGLESRSGTVKLEPPRVESGVEWTRPDTITNWGRVFGVGRNMMSAILEAKKVRHKKLGKGAYQIAVDDLPEDRKDEFRRVTNVRNT